MNYNDPKWQRKRSIILRRDSYLCRECVRYGKSTPATTVHHVIPAEQRPDLKYVNANLLSLCGKCHDAMHDRTNDELTDKGRQWVERVAPAISHF